MLWNNVKAAKKHTQMLNETTLLEHRTDKKKATISLKKKEKKKEKLKKTSLNTPTLQPQTHAHTHNPL